MLPFFTSNAVTRFVPWKPNWALGLLLAAVLAFGALQIAARLDVLAPGHVAGLTAWIVGPAALALAVLAVRWGLMQSLRGRSLRLLAMLHLGFVWSVIALLLATADAALVLLGEDGYKSVVKDAAPDGSAEARSAEMSALNTLADLGPQLALPIFRRFLAEETDAAARRRAVRLLARFPSGDALPLLGTVGDYEEGT